MDDDRDGVDPVMWGAWGCLLTATAVAFVGLVPFIPMQPSLNWSLLAPPVAGLAIGVSLAHIVNWYRRSL